MEKTSKRILPWLLSFITAILLMSGVFVVEASALVSGDYEYTVTDGEAKITGYTGTSTEIEIPSEFDGYPVTSIGEGAFRYNKSLTNITVPDSVTYIGNGSFSYCTSLTSITIGNSVT